MNICLRENRDILEAAEEAGIISTFRKYLKGKTARRVMDEIAELHVTCCGLLHEEKRTQAGECAMQEGNMACGHMRESFGKKEATDARLMSAIGLSQVLGLSPADIDRYVETLETEGQRMRLTDETSLDGYACIRGENIGRTIDWQDAGFTEQPDRNTYRKSLQVIQQKVGSVMEIMRDELLAFIRQHVEPASEMENAQQPAVQEDTLINSEGVAADDTLKVFEVTPL